MATSPLFGWEEPDDTDLVKDGAAAIRTLGNAIDTSMGDLLGGTTGQVLSKNSNTNMDFTWVTSDDANAIQNTIVDAKGDLITATGSDVPARLAVGANGTFLTPDSTTATGLKYATAAQQFPWQTYTPTYTNFTPGNGTVIARYQKVGNLINVFFRITWGSTTSTGNYPIIGYPSTPANTVYFSGDCTLRDVGTTDYIGRVLMDNAGLLFCTEYTGGNWNVLGVVTATDPTTWVTGDIWTLSATYEG